MTKNIISLVFLFRNQFVTNKENNSNFVVDYENRLRKQNKYKTLRKSEINNVLVANYEPVGDYGKGLIRYFSTLYEARTK